MSKATKADEQLVTMRADELAPLTPEQQARLEALAELNDADIDTSDAREMTEAEWADAQRGRFFRPLKRQVTTRLDADVLDWLKAKGPGYQSRMNAILRAAMLRGG